MSESLLFFLELHDQLENVRLSFSNGEVQRVVPTFDVIGGPGAEVQVVVPQRTRMDSGVLQPVCDEIVLEEL